MNFSKSVEELPKSIAKSIDGHFFYSNGYLKLLKDKYFPIYVYDQNFVILVNINKKYIFINAELPVEYICYNEIESQSVKIFLDKLVLFLIKEFKIQWVNITPASAFFYDYPTISSRIPFGSHVINLKLTEEELWNNIHPKHRNGINRSEKVNIETKFGGIELLNEYISLEKETWLRSGIDVNSKESAKNYFNFFPDKIIIAIAYFNGIPQGGGVFFYDKFMSYYMLGATINKPETGAMNLLQWKAIKYMKNIGVNEFSFVGCRINEDLDSKFHGIQRFKERFGGELRVGFMFKVVTKKFYYLLFRFLVKIKFGKTMEDAIEQEINKWKEINN